MTDRKLSGGIDATIDLHGTRWTVEEEQTIAGIREVLAFRWWAPPSVERTWLVVGMRADGTPEGGYMTTPRETDARRYYAEGVRDARYREAGRELPGRRARLVLADISFGRSRRFFREEEP